MAKCFKFPNVIMKTLSNEMRVVLIPYSEQDGLVCALQFPFGRFCDTPNYEGEAELCIGLMQKGPKGMGSEKVSEIFEHHGASIFAEAGEEHAMLGIKLMARFKDTLFPIFWEMITSPQLDENELERLQKEMVTTLKAELNDPGSIANRHFYKQLVDGSLHPAGRHHSIKSIKKITIQTIKKFYNDHVSPQESVLVVAGNFTGEWFSKKCLPKIKQWKPSDLIKKVTVEAVHIDTSAIRLVEKNDLTQATILLGQPAPGELHKDRNKIALANYVLGAGNFSSRLMNRIRSAAGRTYSVTSHITAERYFGALTIATSTQNYQFKEVLQVILEEYALFCKGGITEKELANVKKFAIGNMAFQLEGLTNLVEKILWLSFYNRSISYIESFDAMIESITLDSVNDALKKTLDPDKLIIVAVGKKRVILPKLLLFGKVDMYHSKDVL